jgi:hypothetical protein
MTAALLSLAVLPGAFLAGAFGWVVLTLGADRARLWMEMGPWGYAVVMATGVALTGCMGVLVVRGFKPRLPAAVLLVLGALPWLAGTLGTLVSMADVLQAVAYVNPADKRVILANGMHEALTSYLFGGGLSVLLLGGCALGLGLTALVLARAAKASAAPPALPGVAALLCLAATLGVLSWLPLASVHRDVLEATSNVNPADRALVFALALDGLGWARGGVWVARGLALALAVGAALWAHRHMGVRPLRAVAVVLAVAPAFGLHAFTYRLLEGAGAPWAVRPWAVAGDFEPVPMRGVSAGRADHPDFVVTRTHLWRPYQAEGAVPLAEARRALRERLGRHGQGERPGEAGVSLEPELVLAVDARLDGAALRALVEAAREGGARSLRFVGLTPTSEAQRRLQSERVLAPFLSELHLTALVALPSALPEDFPAREPSGWQARLEGPGVVRLEPRPGSGEQPLVMDTTAPLSDAEQVLEPRLPEAVVVPVYLSLGDGATAEPLARLLGQLARDEERPLLPVLLPGPLPQAAAPMADGATP